jgi:hypothetical protein
VITRAELLSDVALESFDLAEYRLRHNARYHGWQWEKRRAYALGKAFDAIIEARDDREAVCRRLGIAS